MGSDKRHNLTIEDENVPRTLELRPWSEPDHDGDIAVLTIRTTYSHGENTEVDFFLNPDEADRLRDGLKPLVASKPRLFEAVTWTDSDGDRATLDSFDEDALDRKTAKRLIRALKAFVASPEYATAGQ
jgi:DNA-binding LytR/AlgR family response regulator